VIESLDTGFSAQNCNDPAIGLILCNRVKTKGFSSMWNYVRHHLLALKTDRKGLETLEYAVIAAIIIGVGFAGYNTLFGDVQTATTHIGSAITTAAPSGMTVTGTGTGTGTTNGT
jgi:Flp pilus assembly pilin Flp